VSFLSVPELGRSDKSGLGRKKNDSIIQVSRYMRISFYPLCGSFFLSFFKPGGLFSKTTAAHALSYLFNMNRVQVIVSEGLERSQVRVTWDESVVIDRGRSVRKGMSRERYGYGNNTFRVFYGTKEIGGFAQYKFNNWHYHAYVFHLSRQGEQIAVALTISGPDKNHRQLSVE